MKKIIAVVSALLFLLAPVMAPELMAQETGTDSVDKVIVASTENYPDAIVSSAVSQKLGIPVLLTEKDEIPSEVQTTLSEFNPKEVIAVGGPAVISDSVIQALKNDYNVTRLWGMTRYGTAQEVAAHFWPEGSDKALLVENELGEEKGNVMAAAKNLANGKPMLPIPEGKIPAGILTQLQELNVTEVKTVGTKVTNELETNLNDIGVTVKKKVQAESEEKLKEEIEQESLKAREENESLVVVAAGNFGDMISALNSPQSQSLLVSSSEEIQGAVNAVTQRNVKEVKVVGKPDLAQQIADALKNQTDAEVEFEAEREKTAAAQAAKLARQNRDQFAEEFQKRFGNWKNEIQKNREKIKQKANDTLDKVRTLLQNRNATELQEELQEARQKFSQGEFQEALESARETRQELRENRWQQVKGNWTAVQTEIENEVEDLREKTQELSEINREFGQEMRENMTVEERLETIGEFKEEKREKIREVMEAARDKRREEDEEVKDWLEKAERETETEIEVEVKGGVAKVELKVNGTERKFWLNATNRGEIITGIARKTDFEQETVEKNLKLKTEKEREVNETEQSKEKEEMEGEGPNKQGARDEDNEIEESEEKEPEEEVE